MKFNKVIKYLSIVVFILSIISFIIYFLFLVPINNNAAFAKVFEEKLRWQIERQWYWATISRLLDIIITSLAWFSGLVLLALSGYQLKKGNEHHTKIPLWIAVFSALAVSFPALLNTFDFPDASKLYMRRQPENMTSYTTNLYMPNPSQQKGLLRNIMRFIEGLNIL